MSKKRSGIIGIILAVAAVAAVFYAEQVLQPVYAVKSLCKVAAFGSNLCGLSAHLQNSGEVYFKLKDYVER